MGWFVKDRRGPSWKQSWTEQALSSMSLPPLPLLAIFGIIFLHFAASNYVSYKSSVQRFKVTTQFLLYIVVIPCLLFLCVMLQSRLDKVAVYNYSYHRTKWFMIRHAMSVPGGLVLFVVALLMMIWYQTYFHCMWVPAIFSAKYCY
ncbi:hypothetical protein ACFE04_015950 [Oxalis oulophora]